jgi:protease-4
MHQEVRRFRVKRKDVRVVAMMLDVATSGGYYLACAAERIYALPSTVTGSIGVIFQTFSIAGTLRMIGVKTEAIKSGQNKDMASPLHNLTERERKLLQNIIDQFYAAFVKAVLAGRKNLTREKLMPVADGRVLTAPDALQAGLIDELIYPKDLLGRLKKELKISRVKVVMYRRPTGYRGSVYANTDVPTPWSSPTVNVINIDVAKVFGPQPQFLYLWTTP